MSFNQGTTDESKRCGRVAVYGTFDILHEGHFEFLRKARQYGDWLGVILIARKFVMENKALAPIHTVHERRDALLRTGLVDAVFVDSVSQGLRCLDIIEPDIFCLGYDQTTVWEEILQSLLSTRFPRCRMKRLPMFANGIHSRHLRQENDRTRRAPGCVPNSVEK
jgi:cytidyltransferase-like protein